MSVRIDYQSYKLFEVSQLSRYAWHLGLEAPMAAYPSSLDLPPPTSHCPILLFWKVHEANNRWA